MRYAAPSLASAIVVALCNLPIPAQENHPCPEANVPVSVILPDGRIARGLTSTHFQARVDGKSVEIKVMPDTSPRRILLLIDLSKKISDETWKAILAAATHAIEQGRPEDRFAWLTFGGPREFLGFTEPRDAFSEKLTAFARNRPGPAARDVLVLDALAEALEVFSPPRFGDAILLLFGSLALCHSERPLCFATTVEKRRLKNLSVVGSVLSSEF